MIMILLTKYCLVILLENISKIKKYDVKNVLLIGGTGYLGSHIIDSFMKNETGKIYCLIREKKWSKTS